MSTTTNWELQLVTGGLTGRRENDIRYLREQIQLYKDNAQILPVLKNILGCLIPASSHTAAA